MSTSRRQWIQASMAWVWAPLMPTLAHAQSGRALVQILDTSGTQQETARDYSTGWSLAGPGRRAGGLPVLRTLQTDGTERPTSMSC